MAVDPLAPDGERDMLAMADYPPQKFGPGHTDPNQFLQYLREPGGAPVPSPGAARPPSLTLEQILKGRSGDSAFPASPPASPLAKKLTSRPGWTPQMETQYREWRRGGAAGPPENRELWSPQFEERLRAELSPSRSQVPSRLPPTGR